MKAAPRFLLATVLIAFAATRVALYTGVDPIFDADTYKYLGAADSLWNGLGWPPVFAKMHDGGGALHALPGYTWFILAIWGAVGRPTLSGVVLAQAALSGLALLAILDFVRRRYSFAAAAAVGLLLAASPSLAWIDQLLMPEAAGGAVYALAICLAVRSVERATFDERAALLAAICGALMGFGVLLRATAQVFVPFPPLVALMGLRAKRPAAAWIGVYSVTFVLSLLPWMAHNHQLHGHWTLTASTGRNLYFSGVWSDTIDRRAALDGLGSVRDADVDSSYFILDEQFQKFLDSGLDIRQADAAMARLALQEYRKAGLARYIEGRAAILAGLFQEEAFGRGNMTLAGRLSWYLNNATAGDPMRFMMEERWNYRLSPAVVALMREGREQHAGPHSWFRWWVDWLRFDDLSLALAFLAASAVLLASARRHATALLCWAAPVYAFLAMYTVLGAPLYRYQAALHGPMLVMIALALWQAWQKLRARGAWPAAE